MRMLVVGAGATGGYFGARLLEAGRDVTFLVRPRRAEILARNGLVVRSPLGDVTIANPPTVQADALREPFDVVLLSCKAYDLDDAIASFAPAVGKQTSVLPVLNGMRHLDVLDARFGSERVLGGLCLISSTLDAAGAIVQFTDSHTVTYGERGGGRSARTDAIAAFMDGAKMDARVSETILLDMWEKWAMLATLASVTCMMRATVGDIAQAGGTPIALALLEECRVIAEAQGHPLRDAMLTRVRGVLSQTVSPLTASMLRDIERGGPIEADHVIGDLIARGGQDDPHALLRVAYVHLKAYEARRARGGVASA